MKKVLISALSLAMFVMMSCSKGEQSSASETVEKTDTAQVSPEGDSLKVAEGVAVGGAMNSIMIDDQKGDTLEFVYPDLTDDHKDPWQEGDKVKVEYTLDADQTPQVQELRVMK